MSKRANKDSIKDRCRKLGVSIQKLFEIAADWACKAFGQRIRRGAVLEAVGKYKRHGAVPRWMSRWLTDVTPAPA